MWYSASFHCPFSQGGPGSVRAIRAWPTLIGRDLSDIEARHGIQRAADLPVTHDEQTPRLYSSFARPRTARGSNTLVSSAERTQARPRLPCDICSSPRPPIFFLYRVSQRELESRPPSRHVFIERVVESDIRATCTYMYHLYFRDGHWVAN